MKNAFFRAMYASGDSALNLARCCAQNDPFDAADALADLAQCDEANLDEGAHVRGTLAVALPLA
jgi:hypothetical protein